MNLSSDAPMRRPQAVRTSAPGLRVLRRDATEQVALADLSVEIPHNRRKSDRLPPLSEQLASARHEGWDEGFGAGVEHARHSAEWERTEVIRQGTEALCRAAEFIAAGRAGAIAVAQQDAAELAFELTRTLVGHELASATTPGMDAVVRALRLASPGEELTVRLHPDELVDGDALQAMIPDCRVSIVGDAGVLPGGCIVDAGPCRIDAQIQPALERVRVALLAASDPGSEEEDPIATYSRPGPAPLLPPDPVPARGLG